MEPNIEDVKNKEKTQEEILEEALEICDDIGLIHNNFIQQVEMILEREDKSKMKSFIDSQYGGLDMFYHFQYPIFKNGESREVITPGIFNIKEAIEGKLDNQVIDLEVLTTVRDQLKVRIGEIVALLNADYSQEEDSEQTEKEVVRAIHRNFILKNLYPESRGLNKSLLKQEKIS